MPEKQLLEPCYSIPFKVNSKMKPSMHLLLISMIVFMTASTFLPFSDTGGIFIVIMAGLMALLFLYLWIFTGILKKGYVALDNDGISVKTASGKNRVLWIDVVMVNEFNFKNNHGIGLVTKQKLEKLENKQNKFLSLMFSGPYSLAVPLNTFSDIDNIKLLNTIVNLTKVKQPVIIENNAITPFEDEYSGSAYNPVDAFLKTLGVSIIAGIFYGLTLVLFEVNIYFVPIVCSIAIIYFYFKGDNGNRLNLIRRAIIGLLCALQPIVALFTEMIIINNNINESDLMTATSELIADIISKPADYFVVIITVIALFILGSTYDISLNFRKNRKRHYTDQKRK